MAGKNNISRRQFLKSAASFTTGAIGFPYVVSSSALGKAICVAPSNRIVMACIGMGSKGINNMEAFLSNEEVRVVAVCDVDKKKRDKARKIVDDKYQNNHCKVYLDFREVIERQDIDALSLALPDHWHSVPAIMAARAGKDMYAEKPLARTIREGRAMADAVHRYGCVWQTGSQQRSTSNFHRACELVRNGRIGKVHKVEVGLPTGKSGSTIPVEPVPEGLDWDFWLGPAPWRPYIGFGRNGPHWDWRWIMDYSGGQLTDWAGHHIDIAHWALDLERTGPVEIEGRGVYPRDGIYNTPIEYKFTCKYANGLVITVANDEQIPRGTKWYGEDGWIYVKRGKLEADPESVLKEVIGPNEIRLYKSNDHRQNFIDCVKSRRQTIAPIEIGHRSISVGLLGEIAMLTERKLKWDPKKEIFLNDGQANRMLTRPMRSPWHL
jgi:predicted dehydrogenase